MQTIKYTIVNPDDSPDNVQRDTPFIIEVNEYNFKLNNVSIDAQQLAELGMLFFALANDKEKPDLDSCMELLDGFAAPCPVNALETLAQIGKDYWEG